MTDGTGRIARIPALTPELQHDIDGRIREFERDHDDDTVNGGPGWVTRITSADYVIVAAVNLALLIWLLVTWLS